ncbi:MAG: RDD family protein [Acidimicrobiia bacterium]|nr:RDD family protein [Acidimicrobiia bacterium]
MTATVIAGRGIVTPQGVVLDLETAGVGHRGLARFVDLAVLVAVVSLLAFIGELIGGTFGLVFQLITGFIAIFGYPAVAETFFRGRTIGKAAVGLRVVTLEAGPIGFREAIIRSLFQLIDILVSIGAVALLSGMLTQRSQRVGDIAAGTFVIRDPRSLPHLPAVPFTPPMGTEEIVAAIDVSKLRPEQERLIRSFLLRVGELSHAARIDLGTRLADSTALALGHTDRLSLPPEPYLVAVMAARQLREGGLAELAIE